MKTFYTERDIVDLHATGVTEIKIDHGVVLTDLAREKAEALGVRLRQVEIDHQAEFASAARPEPTGESGSDLAAQVKARVVARLGTTAYNEVLDQVIPQVLAQITKTLPPSGSSISSTTSGNDY